MEDWQQDIIKAQIQQELNIEKSMDNSDLSILIKSFYDNLSGSYNRDLFEKSWSKDLQNRLPNGSWKTINGARVFVNDGKVVAGLGGFNKEIDKFFDGKKGKGGGEKSGDKVKERTEKLLKEYYEKDKTGTEKFVKMGVTESTAQIEAKKRGKDFYVKPDPNERDKFVVAHKVKGEAENLTFGEYKNKYESQLGVTAKNQIEFESKQEENKDKPVNERTQKEIGDAKQKIADSMPKPINKMTWEEFKPYGVEMQKQSAHSQPDSHYERLAKMEHDWAIKNDKSQYDTSKIKQSEEKKESPENKSVSLDNFKEVAKKVNSPEEFIKETQKIKNVPPEVAQEFFDKYGKGGSQKDAAEAFLKEHGSKKETSKPDNIESKVGESVNKVFGKLKEDGKLSRYGEFGAGNKKVKEVIQKDSDGTYSRWHGMPGSNDYVNQNKGLSEKDIKSLLEQQYTNKWSKEGK